MKNEINKLLNANDTKPAMRNSDAFWNEFRGRATVQQRTESEPRVIAWWRWAPVPALAAAALIVISATFLWPHPQEARILELDVTAEHTAVMVMVDEEQEGTIVWIDMETL